VDSFNFHIFINRVLKMFYKIEPANKRLYHSICFSGKISGKEASYIQQAEFHENTQQSPHH